LDYVDETERFLPPSFFFICIPILLSILGVLILTQLPWLIMSYNYLRGFSSPTDQAVLVLLGSNLSRMVILISSIIGMMIGLYLSQFITKKLDVVKKEGEAELSARMYFVLYSWWILLLLPFDAVFLLERVFYGPSSSHFLSDLCWFTNAGYLLAFAIPVLLKYGLLLLHEGSIDSQIELIRLRSDTGIKKRFQQPWTLRVIPKCPSN
jgi:hypothetical protein